MKNHGYKLYGQGGVVFEHKAPYNMNLTECVEAGTHHQKMISFKNGHGMDAEINNNLLAGIQDRIKQLKKRK